MQKSPIEERLARNLEPMIAALEWQIRRQVRLGRYTVDFLVLAPLVAAAIECDGHTYHDRTDEQATHDRQRDRSLLRSHHVITLRFSSTELFANAEACATETIRTLHAHGEHRRRLFAGLSALSISDSPEEHW